MDEQSIAGEDFYQGRAISGRRHVQPPHQAHLRQASAQVISNEEPANSRRHLRGCESRPASAGVARRGVWPHQRKHWSPEDHLAGGCVSHDDDYTKFCGHTKARASSTPPGSSGMAAALRNEVMQPPDIACRKSAQSKRVLEMQGNLLGGYLWPSEAPSLPEPFFSRHQNFIEPAPNLIGGVLRLASSPCSVTPPWQRLSREDNLIGGVFR